MQKKKKRRNYSERGVGNWELGVGKTLKLMFFPLPTPYSQTS